MSVTYDANWKERGGGICYSAYIVSSRKTRRRYVVKHNLITEVYLMNVENNYMFRPVLAIIRLSMELKG